MNLTKCPLCGARVENTTAAKFEHNTYECCVNDMEVKKGIGATRLEQLQECVASHSARMIEGMFVDVQSANVILKVHDALQDSGHKEDLMKRHLSQAIQIAWKLV